MPKASTTQVRKRLFGKVRDERLEAVTEVRALTKSAALPLLRKGLRHWDRDLRAACAEALLDHCGPSYAKEIAKAAKSGQLPWRYSVTLLGKHRSAPFLRWAFAAAEKQRDAFAARFLEEVEYDPVIRELRQAKAERDRKTLVIAERRKQAAAANSAARAASLPQPRAADAPPASSASALPVQPAAPPTAPPAPGPEGAAASPAAPSKIRARAKRLPKLDGPIESYDDLDSLLGLEQPHLGFLFGTWRREKAPFDDLYVAHEIPKRHGGTRMIHAPAGPLKAAQRALLDRYLARMPLHEACHGFREGRSTSTNASKHVGNDVVINLDLADFFPTITSGRVGGMLASLEPPVQGPALGFLTALATRGGVLPQGAPTSPVIANLVCRRLDSRLAGLAKKCGANYTRYADDLTFSGPPALISALPRIREIVVAEGFKVATAKTRVLRKGHRQDVTGLSVNSQVSLPRAIRRRLRAAVHAATKQRATHWKGEPLPIQSLRGHLSYLSGVHAREGQRLKAALDKAAPK